MRVFVANDITERNILSHTQKKIINRFSSISIRFLSIIAVRR